MLMHVGEFPEILVKAGDGKLRLEGVGRKKSIHKINVFRAPTLQGVKKNPGIAAFDAGVKKKWLQCGGNPGFWNVVHG